MALITENFPYSHLIASDFIILAGIGFDLSTRKRVHPVWIWGGAFVLATQILRLLIAETEPWLRFAHLMASLYQP